MTPNLSKPLTKAIRTLEGVLLAAATIAPWVISLVDPSKLTHPEALKWSTISAITLGASRTIIKAVTAVKTTTGIAPEPIDVPALAANLAAHIGVALPSTDALKSIVAEGVKVANQSLPTNLEELAGMPPAAVPPVVAPPVVAAPVVEPVVAPVVAEPPVPA